MTNGKKLTEEELEEIEHFFDCSNEDYENYYSLMDDILDELC